MENVLRSIFRGNVQLRNCDTFFFLTFHFQMHLKVIMPQLLLHILFVIIIIIILINQVICRYIPIHFYDLDYDDDENIIIYSYNNIHMDNIKYSKNVIDLSFYGKNLYGIPDNTITGQLVSNYARNATNYDINPEELGLYLEGDILIPKRQVHIRNGLPTISSRWSNAVIPYKIEGNFNQQDIAVIEKAINTFQRYTCIRFIKRTVESDYLTFVSGYSGCWSAVGRIGGRQEVNLQSPGCLSKPGTAIHEIMHALGFLHEQNREDRDDYVRIQYQNIKPQAVDNFAKADHTLNFGNEYDYGSIMHYSPKAFSINGLPTIIPTKIIGKNVMGQRDGFTANDIHKLNSMYDCVENGNKIENSVINSFVNGFLTGLSYNN